MEYIAMDGNGTYDDAHPAYHRGPRVVFNGNGRSLAGSVSQSRAHITLDNDIHQIEQQAYTGVLRAFKMQSGDITWEKESLITELRRELKVSDEEHRVLLNKVNQEEAVHRIRQSRQGGGVVVHDRGHFKRQKIPDSTHSLHVGHQSPIMSLQAMAGNKAYTLAPEDIRWSSASQMLPDRGSRRQADGVILASGRRSGRFHVNVDYAPPNSFGALDFNLIGIPDTGNIVKEVERVLSHPDMYEIMKAKELLRDHEQSLLDAIARLDEAYDGESEDIMPVEGRLGTTVA